jgi:phage-related protein
MAFLPICPFSASYDSTAVRKPRRREVILGDGYVESAPNGIHSNPRVFEVKFGKRSNTEINEISAFLEERNGDPFMWIPYEPFDTPGVFACKDWSLGKAQYNENVITGTFEERFITLDLLPQPIPLDLESSDGLNQVNSVMHDDTWAPAITPLSNAADYPAETRVRVEITHGTVRSTLFTLFNTTFEEPGGILLNHAGVSVVSLDPGVNTWTMVRMRAFNDYFAPSFTFKALYPRTVDAFNSLNP